MMRSDDVLEGLKRENARLREAVLLFVEEVDDPCRRRQPDGEAVYLSQALISLARAAVS